jgi:hypothetical protein
MPNRCRSGCRSMGGRRPCAGPDRSNPTAGALGGAEHEMGQVTEPRTSRSLWPGFSAASIGQISMSYRVTTSGVTGFPNAWVKAKWGRTAPAPPAEFEAPVESPLRVVSSVHIEPIDVPPLAGVDRSGTGHPKWGQSHPESDPSR